MSLQGGAPCPYALGATTSLEPHMRRRAFLLALLTLGATATASVTPADAAARYRVTESGPRAALRVNASFQITGAVTPKAPGKTVALQLLAAGRWRSVGTARLNAASRYVFRYRVPAAGASQMRVVKPAARKIAAGTGAALRVTGLKPATTLTLSSGQVDTGAGLNASYTVTNLPVGATVVLQRTMGTTNTYGTIATAGAAPSGTVSLPAPPQGAYRVRAAVRLGTRLLAGSAGRPLYSYSNVTMASISGSSSRTIQIGDSLFRYSAFGYSDASPALHLDSTTCRSFTFQAAKGVNNNKPGAIKVIQENADPVVVVVPAGQVVSGAAVLTGSAFDVQISSDSDFATYLDGMFSCYTDDGRLATY